MLAETVLGIVYAVGMQIIANVHLYDRCYWITTKVGFENLTLGEEISV